VIVKFVWAIVCCLLFFSCNDKFENPSGENDAVKFYRYFPLSTGKYVIYDVDSIVHETDDDNTNTPDSLKTYYHFQIM